MANRNWNGLSAGYRARLERGGITRAQYERGVSLSAARGHGGTPERPEQAQRRPEDFADYLNRRMTLENEITGLKDQHFGATRKFNQYRSDKNVKINSRTGKLHSKKELTRARDALLNYDDNEEWWENVDEELLDIIGYH